MTRKIKNRTTKETRRCPYNVGKRTQRHVVFSARSCVALSQRIADRMCAGPSLSVIHTVTIGTTLNNNGVTSGHGLKNATCKQTLNLRIRRVVMMMTTTMMIIMIVVRVNEHFT